MSHGAIRFHVPIPWLQRTLYEIFHDAGWSDIDTVANYKIVWYDETTFMGI